MNPDVASTACSSGSEDRAVPDAGFVGPYQKTRNRF